MALLDRNDNSIHDTIPETSGVFSEQIDETENSSSLVLEFSTYTEALKELKNNILFDKNIKSGIDNIVDFLEGNSDSTLPIQLNSIEVGYNGLITYLSHLNNKVNEYENETCVDYITITDYIEEQIKSLSSQTDSIGIDNLNSLDSLKSKIEKRKMYVQIKKERKEKKRNKLKS